MFLVSPPCPRLIFVEQALARMFQEISFLMSRPSQKSGSKSACLRPELEQFGGSNGFDSLSLSSLDIKSRQLCSFHRCPYETILIVHTIKTAQRDLRNDLFCLIFESHSPHSIHPVIWMWSWGRALSSAKINLDVISATFSFVGFFDFRWAECVLSWWANFWVQTGMLAIVSTTRPFWVARIHISL
jgi:hypothetical protein